ncbi:hypothetical protein I070019H7_20560 [Bifidobacterium longum]
MCQIPYVYKHLQGATAQPEHSPYAKSPLPSQSLIPLNRHPAPPAAPNRYQFVIFTALAWTENAQTSKIAAYSRENPPSQ